MTKVVAGERAIRGPRRRSQARRRRDPEGGWRSSARSPSIPGALLLGIPLILCASGCPLPVADDDVTSSATPTFSGVIPEGSLREATDAQCSDDVDNDHDGYTDCADRACQHTASVTVCGRAPGPESTNAACSDGVDNDGDQADDCQDWDCLWNADVTVCDRDRDGYTPRQGDCFDHPTLDLSEAVSPGVPEMCGDGEDNDCDGQAEESNCVQLDLGLRQVDRVSDGDTLQLEGLGSVRLKGIDTPETHASGSDGIECYGPEAADRTGGLVSGGSVRVILDPVDYRTQFRDIYDRLLAHIYVDDGTYVNGLLVEEGFACVWQSFDCYNKVELLQLEDEAQAADRGLWGACGASVCF